MLRLNGILKLLILISIPMLHQSTWAAERIALVIGNSNYDYASSLRNPVNDAQLIATKLRTAGFELVGNRVHLDLNKQDFETAVQQFGDELVGAEVALFYFAGHGIQVDGINYLIPVSANPKKKADVNLHMLNANHVLLQMEGTGARMKLMILDACRNNPFQGRGIRSVSQGLAQVVAPEGTIISFSTQPGNVALDGTGKNSPFSAALADAILKPGVDIFRTFNGVGLAVSRITGGQQRPWLSSSPIEGQFYFVPPNEEKQITKIGKSDGVREAWRTIQDSNDIEILQEFVQHFSGTFYSKLALRKIEKLREVRNEKPNKIAIVEEDTPQLATVRAFFQALSNADGFSAVQHVVPKKRGKGAYVPSTMSKFYASLKTPLNVSNLITVANGKVAVTYRYTRPNGQICQEIAKVTTQEIGGQHFVRRIEAEC